MNVIQYFDFYERGKMNGLIMEYANGGTLWDLIRDKEKRSLETFEVREILVQVTSGLDHAHDQGIVHRDIKGDNILIHQQDGKRFVKLADFGVATELIGGGSALMTMNRGTTQYFSPERAKGDAYGTKSDMWALGCLVIELHTRARLM